MWECFARFSFLTRTVCTCAFHPDDVARFRSERREGFSTAAAFEIEARLLGKAGRHRWFLFRYNPLRNDEGRITRWFTTATDIEDRKHAELRMHNENLALREEIDRSSMYEAIVGSSEALRKVLSQIDKVAPTDSTVLILGETGTGKELIASAIHKRSKRSARALIRVNCGAIPGSLILSELFGHEKGAFTGALQQRTGRFEAADGGTIFLDEVGELSAETQVALLRVLQEQQFERVGGSRSISVDTRVVAARNIQSEPDSAEYLRKLCLREGRTELRACYPADICNILISIGKYEGRPPYMSKSELERASALYFAKG